MHQSMLLWLFVIKNKVLEEEIFLLDLTFMDGEGSASYFYSGGARICICALSLSLWYARYRVISVMGYPTLLIFSGEHQNKASSIAI